MFIILVLSLYSTASATLIKRANNLIYDDVLNITWMQDANYSATSSFSSDGKMNWDEANNWAEQLVYAGHTNWRLPTISPVNGIEFNDNNSYDGSTDRSFNITTTHSELSYMFYTNLGNLSAFDSSGNYSACESAPNYCLSNSSFYNGGNNNDVISFFNIKSWLYWTNTELESSSTNRAWAFSTIGGKQTTNYKSNNTHFSWAVSDGDIAKVPEPSSILLFGLFVLYPVFSRPKKFGLSNKKYIQSIQAGL